MATDRRKVLVVGGGIVGASLAYYLARRGAAVTLLDQGPAAGAVTSKAFAWINASHGLPQPYRQLRHLALQDYRRLEGELQGVLQVDWCGALTWTRDPAETERFAREHAASGYDVRLVGRDEAAALEPALITPPETAAFAAAEGAVDPIATTKVLLRAAQQAGAEIRLNIEPATLTADDGRVTGVSVGQETIESEVVVLAAGTGTAALCAPLGLTLSVAASPAILLRFRTDGRLVKRVISSPGMEVRQEWEGSLLAAEDYVDETPENGPEAIAGRAFAAIRERLSSGTDLALQEVAVGLRPIPADGLPIVGFSRQVPGLYLAVMHAGVTLAPAVGRLSTTEIMDGADAPELQACRLERFTHGA